MENNKSYLSEADCDISDDFESSTSSNSTMEESYPNTQNSEKVCSLPDPLKALQDYLDVKLADISKLKKIDNLEQMLRKNLESHDSRITKLEDENLKLKQKITQLSNDNELLTKELRNKNLIISGIPESESETDASLRELLLAKFQSITKKTVQIDSAYRLRRKEKGVVRHVKVLFVTFNDRNCVYLNRTKTEKGVFINEDLHKNTRRDHALLRRKRKELSDKQINSKLNLSKLTVEAETGEVFEIVNGVVVSKTTPAVSEPVAKNGKTQKRKGHQPDPGFIGSGNLRGSQNKKICPNDRSRNLEINDNNI